MAIPDYKTIMLPLLKTLEDGREHKSVDLIETLANYFKLTEQERKELLPSGKQIKFNNRVGWARTYLKKAGLIESPQRALHRITARGIQVLKDNPIEITPEYLLRFVEFQNFYTVVPKEPKKTQPENQDTDFETPEEIIENNYQQLRKELANDLIEQIKTCSPKFFETLVVELLIKMGYGGSRADAGQAIGQTGDGGIDGIIKEDRLGLDAIYIQAKRWEGTVGRPIIQGFAGSLEGFRAKKGVFITTSQFSSEAKQYINQIEKRIVLIDGETLAQMMIDYDIGVSVVSNYAIKRIDSDYFSGDY